MKSYFKLEVPLYAIQIRVYTWYLNNYTANAKAQVVPV